jgi:DNA-binding NarL/FixJ family response regulator
MTDSVLIVDDHPLTRDALRGLLDAGGFDVVGEASSGSDAVRLAADLQPELVVLDLGMPGMSGLEALPKLRAAAPRTQVVVLTAAADDENLLAAIRAGAAGYLLKSEPPEQITAFLRGIIRGEAALSSAVARRLFDEVRRDDRRGHEVPQEVADALSARELEVLLLLDRHLSTEEIAQRLFISEHTVRSHVKNLMAKLDVSSRREAIAKLNREPS